MDELTNRCIFGWDYFSPLNVFYCNGNEDSVIKAFGKLTSFFRCLVDYFTIRLTFCFLRHVYSDKLRISVKYKKLITKREFVYYFIICYGYLL